MRQDRLSKLTPDSHSKTGVVRDMFNGAPHTLPPIDDIFDQYMSYFVTPNKSNNENKQQQHIGNTNMILPNMEEKNNNKNEIIEDDTNIFSKENIIINDKKK
eukprot:232976_1